MMLKSLIICGIILGFFASSGSAIIADGPLLPQRCNINVACKVGFCHMGICRTNTPKLHDHKCSNCDEHCYFGLCLQNKRKI